MLDKKLPPMPSNIPALYKDLVFSMLSYEKFLRPDAESKHNVYITANMFDWKVLY